MIAPGDDYHWYEELPQREDEIGNHRSSYSALNVANPQPGYHYYWEHYHPKGNYSDVVAAMNAGWIPVRAGDPEFNSHHGTNDFLQPSQNPDGLKVFGDVCLMKIPLDTYRAMQELAATEAKNQLYGQADAHIDRGDEMARRFGHNAPQQGKHLYYAREIHNIQSEVVDPNATTSK